jgi:hypothetical protein
MHPSHRTVGALNIRAAPTDSLTVLLQAISLDCHSCGTMEAEVFWLSEVKVSESDAEQNTKEKKQLYGKRKCTDRTISFMVL